ncbi:MAG TPA: response regulator transcription factor [Thermoleophilaceae bacterium]|nr:response regulator transcription factor [Thermoleophilaceae bacterium]
MRVVVADDSLLVRQGVIRVAEEAGFEVVAQAADLDDLMRKTRAHKPDAVVVDIRMPPDHADEGLRAAAAIREELPGTGVLVVSQYVDEHYALQLLSNGTEGVGYLLKDRISDPVRFAEAIERVADGGSALDPEVVSFMVRRKSRDDPIDQLSPRERDVMELMAEGRTNRAIAAELVVTERAVERHVTSIFGKLGLSNQGDDHRRVLAVLAYLRS